MQIKSSYVGYHEIFVLLYRPSLSKLFFMEITITDSKTLAEVQAEFNQHFPFLKLEFFKKHNEEGEGSKKSEAINLSKKIADVRSIYGMEELSINGHKKVSTLEDEFFECYGMNVQVFRKSGKAWLQTTTTDSWTLTEQNNEGKEHETLV